MAIQVQGSGGVVAQVETNTQAVRVVNRPTDVGALGAYSLGAVSGVMAAGLAAGSPVFSFRYGGAGLVLLKRVYLSMGNAGTAFAAGVASFNVVVARSFTASDSGGTSVLPTLNKMRTGQATTGLADLRIASTATLTAGTRTLDGQPLSSTLAGVPAVAGQTIIPPSTPLFDRENSGDQWPLVLATNEGFILTATVPATGTWTFAVHCMWEEVSTYGTGLAV